MMCAKFARAAARGGGISHRQDFTCGSIRQRKSGDKGGDAYGVKGCRVPLSLLSSLGGA